MSPRSSAIIVSGGGQERSSPLGKMDVRPGGEDEGREVRLRRRKEGRERKREKESGVSAVPRLGIPPLGSSGLGSHQR